MAKCGCDFLAFVKSPFLPYLCGVKPQGQAGWESGHYGRGKTCPCPAVMLDRKKVDNLEFLVSGIEQKALGLRKILERMEMENRQLKSRVGELEVSLELYKQKVKELENKNSILKVSGSLNRSTDKQESQKAKAFIDGLIKEIDRCLMLLEAV